MQVKHTYSIFPPLLSTAGTLLAQGHQSQHRAHRGAPTEGQEVHRPPPEHPRGQVPRGRLRPLNLPPPAGHRAGGAASHEAVHTQGRRGGHQ